MRRMILGFAAVALALAFYSSTRQSHAGEASSAATRSFTSVNMEYKGAKVWVPGVFIVKKGEKVKLKLVNEAPSGMHGFSIDEFGVKADVHNGKPTELEFAADKAGLFRVYCQHHPAHVSGQLLVLE